MKLSIGGIEIRGGDKLHGEIAVADLSVGELNIEYVVVTGREEGPIVYVGAGQHGDEVTSVLAAMRLARSLGPDTVRKGAVIIVPVQNPVAVFSKRRQGMVDLLDMNRVWPGSREGSLTELIVDKLFNTLIARASHVVDLHTAASDGENAAHTIMPPREKPPVATGSLDWDRIVRDSTSMAKCFKTSFARYTVIKPEHERSYYQYPLGQLHVASAIQGKPAIVVELGEGGRVDEEMVKVGVEGVESLLKSLNIIDYGDSCNHSPILLEDVETIRAPRAGVVVMQKKPGAKVRKGEVLAMLETIYEAMELKSPIDGYVVRIRRYGFVEPGERIAVLGAGSERL